VNGRAILRFLVPRAPVLRAFGEAPKAGTPAEQQAPDGAAIASRLIVPLGLAVSCLAHLAFLGPAFLLSRGNPFDTPPAEAITVDIVPPEDDTPQPAPETTAPAPAESASPEAADNPSPAAPSASQASPPSQSASNSPAPRPARQEASQPEISKPETAKPEAPKQAASKPAPALQSALPLPPPPFTQQQPQPPAEPPPTPGDPAAVFAMPLTMPDGSVGGHTFDSEAVDRANLDSDVVSAVRDHMKTCLKLPAGVSPEVKVVLRVYLKPDGSLVTGLPQNPEPVKVEGVSLGGGALYQAAVAALRRCQPYRMLPTDRYGEWKRLDIPFTPRNF
jgi:hypothetical protein